MKNQAPGTTKPPPADKAVEKTADKTTGEGAGKTAGKTAGKAAGQNKEQGAVSGLLQGPPGVVDTAKFAEEAGLKTGVASTSELERLDSSLDGEPGRVNWRFSGRLGRMADGSLQRWLSLAVNMEAEMTCARCDEPAPVVVEFEREFLLVGDERRAQMLDDEAEEYDVLVGERRFSLTDLLEDECLMSLPTFVSHDSCQPVSLEQDEEPPRNPFAALAKLKTGEKP